MLRRNLFTSQPGGLKTTGMEDISDESEEVADEDDSHNHSHDSTDKSGIEKQPQFEEGNEDDFNSCDIEEIEGGMGSVTEEPGILESEVLLALDDGVFVNPPNETKVEVWVNNYLLWMSRLGRLKVSFAIWENGILEVVGVSCGYQKIVHTLELMALELQRKDAHFPFL